MEARPEFTVIAGPNGAGKSRLSPYYIHCKSFDGNLLALNLRKEHPEWEERWIGGTVTGELQKQKENSISLHYIKISYFSPFVQPSSMLFLLLFHADREELNIY